MRLNVDTVKESNPKPKKATLNKQVELQNNLNDLIKKTQKNREKKD